MRKLAIISLFLFFFSSDVTAQELQITNYSPREGIPVYGVNSIFQDSKGWMWFTTGYEVMRYDGHRYRVYPPARGIVMEFCFKIVEVGNEIWVISSPYALKISGDSLHKLDVRGATKDIISHLQKENRSYFLMKDGLYELNERSLKPLITDPALQIRTTESLLQYDDSLFVSHEWGKLLVVFNMASAKVNTIPLKVTDVVKNNDGIIFIQVPGTGILRIRKISTDKNGLTVITDPEQPITDERLNRFVSDGFGNFWTYKIFNYLAKFDSSGKVRMYNESHGLPSLWINQMFVDREKNLWVGFNGGLSKIRNTNWDRFTVKESMYSNHILFLSNESDTKDVFIGTQNGVNIFRDGQMKRIQIDGLPFFCQNIIKGEKVHYYLRDSILYSGIFDGNNLSFHSEKKLANLKVSTGQLIKYRTGLFISSSNGIYHYDQNLLRRVSPDDSHFRYIMMDRSGKLWAGKFAAGLHCFSIVDREGKVELKELLSVDSLLPSTPRVVGIRAMTENKNGDIIVGTRNNGLFILDLENDRLVSAKHLGEDDGLHSNTIWGLSTDSAGDCWVSTMKGLNLLKKINESWIILDEGTKRQLYQSSMVYVDSLDHVWVANHPGVVMIRKENEITPDLFSVSITEMNINGKSVDVGTGKIYERLKYRDNDVQIEFSANTYRDEHGVLYSWRLDKNSEWSAPSTFHNVNYSALGPGKYEFSVKALNPDGTWSLNEAGFEFEVLPPFWQQLWFIASIIGVIALALYILYRYRMKQLKELYEMRNMIARDLHDEIGSTLTSINILSSVSLRNLHKDDIRSAELLDKVVDQSQQIQQNMSDIVWAIKPDNDRLENMTIRMREYLSHTLEPRNIDIDFHADSMIMQASLSMQERRDFFLIFKEAINNIAKYSQCSCASVLLKERNGSISLQIRDDGIGFDKESSKAGNGLKNMQHRAGLIKGTLKIVSSPGNGTVIELLIPTT